jgi:hypothetical protein
MHGVNDALALRHSLMKLRVEVMMEQALAHMCRSTFQSADAVSYGSVLS